MKKNCIEFIRKLPKAELHVHLEGTLEPTQLLFFADRNNIHLPYKNVDEVKSALYFFYDLASFIAVYRQAIDVLKTERDFYDLVVAYLKKIASQGVLHTEIFIDLQSYTHRNVKSALILNGLHAGLIYAKEHYNISANLILCFLRDLSEEDAFSTLELVRQNKDIRAIGLASVEKGNPPVKFVNVFKKAREDGYHLVAHAGEEAGADYVWQALQLLQVERIDHGIACMQDPKLIQYLVEKKIPLTVCPLSNVALNCVPSIKEHPLKKMYDAGLMVTINSDDPAFFKGYIDDNYQAVMENLNFSCAELIDCARNSFMASFITEAQKKEFIQKLDEYVLGHSCE